MNQDDKLATELAHLIVSKLNEDFTNALDVGRSIVRLGLVKRPVAFRVKNNLGIWVFYEDEKRAAEAAEHQHTDYQGLYARDGK